MNSGPRIRRITAHAMPTHAAACEGMDTLVFFPENEESEASIPAKAVCAVCPVRDACREYAIENGIQSGIFGKTTPRERRIIKRRRTERKRKTQK